MTDIGSSMSGLGQGLRDESAQAVRGEMPRVPEKTKPEQAKQEKAKLEKTRQDRKHGLWESITASLDLACRGYLCMQIVDCDPVSDPDCGASGKKVVVREVPGNGHATASETHASGSGTYGPVTYGPVNEA